MISVVIPTLNEARNIGRCIALIEQSCSDCEIIVADGGSSDATLHIVSGLGNVKLLNTERGRGQQMNAGASIATGEVLLFLHADTWLDPEWSSALKEILSADNNIVGGAYTLRIDNRALKYRLVEAMVRLRCRLFKMPYGDQAIFIRRNTFKKLGGYAPIPLMEDVELVGRMKKEGTIAILDCMAHTDSRRWEKKGVISTSLSNLFTLLMYKMGVSPERLFRRYYR